MTIVNQGMCDELNDLIAPEERLKAYGGTREDPESWWPPNVSQSYQRALSEPVAQEVASPIPPNPDMEEP